MSNKKVIGLGYDPASDIAPTVMLKGTGAEAEAALELARREGDIPIVKDAALVDALYRVPIDGQVGRELFPVMAALLAHVMQIDKELGARSND